ADGTALFCLIRGIDESRLTGTGNVSYIHTVGDRLLCTVTVGEEARQFLACLVDGPGMFLSGIGTDDGWEFTVRFPSHGAVRRFRDRCAEIGADIDVTMVYRAPGDEREDGYGLTDLQRETLEQAVVDGYYEVPRNVTLQHLADDLDRSDQATSERLRRAVSTLVDNTLLVGDDVD
ncbi:hypothetical protein BRD17_09115, partial [Halobacteriales archaeon SW_7_68_16]